MASSRRVGLRELASLLIFGLGFLGIGGVFGALVWRLSTGESSPPRLLALMGGSLVLLLAGRALRPPPRPSSLLTILSPLQFAPAFLLFAIGRSLASGTPVELASVVATLAVVAVAVLLGQSLQPHGLSYSAWR